MCKPGFRLATAEDAVAIAAMSRDLIEAGLGWSWGPERVARCIRDPDTVALIVAGATRIQGFTIMHFDDERAHLNLLAVRPMRQRHGIGSRMVEWLMQSALTAGIASVSLEVRESNAPARCFYRACGFVENGEIQGYYRGRETAIRMVRVLRCAGAALPAWPQRSAR